MAVCVRCPAQASPAINAVVTSNSVGRRVHSTASRSVDLPSASYHTESRRIGGCEAGTLRTSHIFDARGADVRLRLIAAVLALARSKANASKDRTPSVRGLLTGNANEMVAAGHTNWRPSASRPNLS